MHLGSVLQQTSFPITFHTIVLVCLMADCHPSKTFS